MTTADPQHVRAGGVGRVWQGFRRWRRSRPFWGGLFTALAGVEMFASTRMTINGLSFHSGATGLYSLLIPIILVTCALLLWFSPAQRLFYSIVAAVTTIYSLMGLNLGGFFVGLLLGLVGSALAFAWTPISRPAPAGPDATAPPVGSSDPTGPEPDDRAGEPLPDVPRPRDEVAPVWAPVAPGASAVPPAPGAAGPAVGGHPDARHLGVVLVVLGLSAGGLMIARPAPVQAAPAAPVTAPTACPTPTAGASKPSGTPTPSTPRGPGTPPATPTAGPSPSPTPSSGGNIITDILHGIGDLLTGGQRSTPTASPTVSPSASPRPSATGTPRASARPTPTAGRPSGAPTGCPPVQPGPSRTVEPGRLMPKIAPEPGQPRVAQRPSKLTGSKVTMTGLRFEGIVELPTANGTLKALKFSMAKAVTDDFKLVADGPAGRHQQYATDRLTVQGDVAFYATRFVGRLLGIKITLTPDLPFPDGIPITSPIPITFTDPVIDLAFVDSNTLTARPTLELSLV
ncbi:DUF6114 domain-containing protein [Micromonospora sp. R77]|uniref:DUF6114 domain-containing protein n=1 Tax=Micromonospora sp. R77 TaxID=2925836 RepID=UPI001F620C38|nr:DUF6114 domain-containing protein [Micromonospora sp. R77]MCI4063216.1 DUF6114 domain-containing protein [Micromonospora sp. R77]